MDSERGYSPDHHLRRIQHTGAPIQRQTLSAHREASFGTAYGVLIRELRLLSRAIFIVDRDDTVRYVEYVKEVTQHPDYDKAIEALQNAVARS